jgi:hypothetical protein
MQCSFAVSLLYCVFSGVLRSFGFYLLFNILRFLTVLVKSRFKTKFRFFYRIPYLNMPYSICSEY